MELKRSRKVITLVVLCVFAVAMNVLLNIFVKNFLQFPLFMDTVFTAAIAFTSGPIPGISVAALTWLIPGIYYKSLDFFVICSVVEVLLICAFKPPAPVIPDFAPKEKVIVSYSGLAAKLMLLYILCAIVISVLGGVIDYVSQLFLKRQPLHYSPEDTFKLGLIMNNLPVLAVSILSRIPVNIVDRFIVIFGGYFISRGLVKFTR
jgi:hypothetical protein